MTSTVNGIGTHLSGQRQLTPQEVKKWGEKIPYIPGLKQSQLYIATKSFVLLFLPIIPLETVVYYYLSSGWNETTYRQVFYPAGEGSVYWEHVKNSWVFWLTPAIILLIILFNLFG
jgi:hypothetical protein